MWMSCVHRSLFSALLWENPDMSYVEDSVLLMSHTGQRMHEAFLAVVGDEALASNVSITTLMVLHRDGPLRAMPIAELTGLTSGGATKLIDRLERGGLVVREKGAVPDDGRAVVVSLTDSGTTAAERIIATAEPHVDALTDALIAMRGSADSPTV
jgi:DNA-binding MarR family transcriptional regulator